jgi:hypothetical protein
MPSYILVGSSSIVQIISPSVAAEMVAATIQTVPTGIIATTLVPQVDFDSAAGASDLTDFADAIEAVIADGKAVAGSGTSKLDTNGLQQYYVTFEVAYNPPGAPTGTVHVDVDVPASFLTMPASEPGMTRRMNAFDLIDKAYDNLVALAGG